MKYIVELEPGLFLRHGPVIKYISTSQQGKANRYDSRQDALADVTSAYFQRISLHQYKNPEVIEVTE